ncbi:class IIc cyclic bacteriocin [Companilactobacillus nodensis]|uniref:Uncharacterized protein n=1 Tax=Companilactobacillus nodensis DSM 19682 = JCM 14932 = NBRC 107160 TaxID=1423775 RepID=A0A0R1KAP1_9LACO|nr:class IIc cyclic bacteriocin [Companilactobacillus nodensis]KRK80408.1 hypothetical protein FD03_GL001828 [Companilactobacillus nodensis DSM 19682 = JCM 14932 = NBRC 107160]
MKNNLSVKYVLNKYEIATIVSFVLLGLMLTTVHVIWIAGLFGIHLDNSLESKLVSGILNGGSAAGVFAAMLGITLPAWAAAAATAMGATAA